MAAPPMEKTGTRGIFKRGNRYVITWRHKGKQHKEFFRTFEEAREAKGRRMSGETRPVPREMFEDYARAWIASYSGRTSRGFSDSGRRDYKRALDMYAIPFFERYRLADIEPTDIRAFVAHLERKGLAYASVIKNLTPLKAMFATAVEDGQLRVNPMTGVRVNRRRDDEDAEEPKAKVMTRLELGAVLGHISAVPDLSGTDWHLFSELLASTGLRISEALGLNRSDVMLGVRPHLYVRRQFYDGKLKPLKTRNSRRKIPLSRGMAQRLFPICQGDDGPLFSRLDGTRYTDDGKPRSVLDRASGREATKAIANGREPHEAARTHAGLPWVHFHTFRHTYASMLYEEGHSDRRVSARLGHYKPSFTMDTYVHLLDDDLDDAIDVGGAVPLREAM